MFYRGKEGQWSWIFHRLTGIGVLLFLIAHIVDTVLIAWGPEVYNKVMALYRHPLFKIGEVGLFGSVLYHSFNGIRITLIDFWPAGTKYHKQMFYVVMTLFIICMIPVSFLMLTH